MPEGNFRKRLAQATALHRERRYEEAERVYRDLVQSRPGDPAVAAGLGELLLATGRNAEAIAFLEIPARLPQADAEALSNLGFAHLRNGTYEFGLRYLLDANARRPDDWRILSNLGQTYLGMDSHREAAMHFEAASRLNPSSVELQLKLAGAMTDLGDFERARVLFENCLVDPRHAHAAIAGLVRAGKQTESQNYLPAIEAGLQAATDPAARRNLHFAAAKTYLDLGDADRAFAHLASAKTKAAGATFSRDAFAAAMAQSMRLADLVGDAVGDQASAPIFIVGMPRCGSSLTEQILSGDPALFGAGERQYLPTIARRLGFGSGDPEAYAAAIRRLPADALPAIAGGYRSLMASAGARDRRTIDKFLHNFLHIGLIKLLFPAAQIIHCRRQPLDCCLSIYMSPFGRGHDYADDLGDLGWYYRQYEALMNFWTERFPQSILTVDYETTVGDLEASARRILDFLGLEWNPAVLDFTRNERGVSTASRWQVRQPLYRTSIERWRPYEKHLQPLIAALASEGA